MNQFQNKTAINPVTNQKLNPDDRVDALNALRRKVGRLIGSDAVVIQEINQEAIDAAMDASIEDAIEAGLDVQTWVSFRCTPEQKLMLKSACHDRGIAFRSTQIQKLGRIS